MKGGAGRSSSGAEESAAERAERRPPTNTPPSGEQPAVGAPGAPPTKPGHSCVLNTLRRPAAPLRLRWMKPKAPLLAVCEALSGGGRSGALEGRSPLRPLLFWAALAYELTCADFPQNGGQVVSARSPPVGRSIVFNGVRTAGSDVTGLLLSDPLGCPCSLSPLHRRLAGPSDIY
ncbi:unnamed protein product [Arctogadus glacialis]